MSYVYRDLDQAALDFQYNNQAQVPDPKRYLDWYGRTSAAVRERIAHIANVAYGTAPDERLDIFQPPPGGKSGPHPVVVFVHGGAWRNLDLAGSSFAAETFTAHGALYVPLGFSCMPTAGSLDRMVAQVRDAIAWVARHIHEYGGDAKRIYLLGHSSGGHLAGMSLVTDWPKLYGLPADLIRGAVLVSGIYDLEPVRLSYRNTMLGLDQAAETRNSPCRNLPAHGAPLLVAHGELETSEFKRQSRAFADLWQKRFGNCREMEVQGVNHYEVIETLVDAKSPLAQATLAGFGM